MKIVSLFSGAGGLDLGLIKAGHEIIWANDFDADSCETYKRNIGEHIVCSDIAKIKIDDIPNCSWRFSLSRIFLSKYAESHR
jgi:DNA (cytosine-5)-methyltransferase 1